MEKMPYFVRNWVFFFLREIMNQLQESIPIELFKKPMEYLQSEIILNGKCLNLLETDSDFG